MYRLDIRNEISVHWVCKGRVAQFRITLMGKGFSRARPYLGNSSIFLDIL